RQLDVHAIQDILEDRDRSVRIGRTIGAGFARRRVRRLPVGDRLPISRLQRLAVVDIRRRLSKSFPSKSSRRSLRAASAYRALTQVLVRFTTDAGDFAAGAMGVNGDVQPIVTLSSR